MGSERRRAWGRESAHHSPGWQPEHQRATLRQHQVGPQGPSRAAPSGCAKSLEGMSEQGSRWKGGNWILRLGKRNGGGKMKGRGKAPAYTGDDFALYPLASLWLYDSLRLLKQCLLEAWLGAQPIHFLGCVPLPGVPSPSHVPAVQWCIFLLPDAGHMPRGTGSCP